MKEIMILARCPKCWPVKLELWVPPTVRCPKCKAVFVWANPVVCVSSHEMAINNVVRVDQIEIPE